MTIEDEIVEEVEGSKESSFIYILHEDNRIDTEGFNRLVKMCKELLVYYTVNGKNDRYVSIIRQIIDCFEYTMMTWGFHLSSNDLCHIINYDKLENEGIISYINDEMRCLSGELIF